MGRAKPPVVKLADLEPGHIADFFALLAEKTRGTTRDGKPFFSCRFRDARRTVAFMAWADGGWFEVCERDWHAGQCYKLRGSLVASERYGPQLEIVNIRAASDADRADGYDPAGYVEHSRFDPATMHAELLTLCREHIADEPLRGLVTGLLETHADALKRLPASPRNYYPFAGGWLEHTLNVTRHCLWLAERYAAHHNELRPPLNRDLVVAAAALHEIGRVRELDDALPPQLTVTGRLTGPILLARDMVREAAAARGDLDLELQQLLEHLIVSHLTLPEWGSPRLPLVPEALILHHADDLDVKMEMYARCLTRDAADGPFTDRDPVLNRQLYKGRRL
jgi:3'-5' exoribonuclease